MLADAVQRHRVCVEVSRLYHDAESVEVWDGLHVNVLEKMRHPLASWKIRSFKSSLPERLCMWEAAFCNACRVG